MTTQEVDKWTIRIFGLGMRPVRSESLLCAQWVAKDSSSLHADSEDSDQTGTAQTLIRPGLT